MPPGTPGESCESLKIVKSGREVSSLVSKVHQTTKIIDLDPS